MKEIQLTKGKIALVDDEDYEKINSLKWYANGNSKYGRYYAARRINNKNILMHRFIMNCNDVEILIDHADGNTLNNCKSNLRIATRSQNNQNLYRKNPKNKSGFRGVHLKLDKKRPNPWRAQIRINGKLRTIGHFKTAEEAAKAFDKSAKQLFGQFCGKLNFE